MRQSGESSAKRWMVYLTLRNGQNGMWQCSFSMPKATYRFLEMQVGLH